MMKIWEFGNLKILVIHFLVMRNSKILSLEIRFPNSQILKLLSLLRAAV